MSKIKHDWGRADAMTEAERHEAAMVVFFERGVTQQGRDTSRRRFALGPRQAAVMRGREDRVVAALQMLHHVGPLTAQRCERGVVGKPRQCVRHVGISVAHVLASAGSFARNLLMSSSSTYSSPRSSGLLQPESRAQVLP